MYITVKQNVQPFGNVVVQAIQHTADDPGVEETDWSAFFEGLNGSAVLYDPAENQYQIYNLEEAQTRIRYE